MITYGCPPERTNELAARLERIANVTGLPMRVGRLPDGGVFIKWTVADRNIRSESHWALMDAERVLGVREITQHHGAGCRQCGASCTNYVHTPAFCAALVKLRQEFGIGERS